MLRVPGSQARLLKWQACALWEAYENAEQHGVGAWLALPVGTGKTLIMYLLGKILAAKRVLMIVTRLTMDQVKEAFISYVRDWGGTPYVYQIKTWSSLSPESGEHVLERFQPDLIVIDESHKLANARSSASRRIDRYIVQKQEAVKVVAMTGTPSRKSIMSYWHILGWCLRHMMPLPMHEGEANEWAAALDEGVWGMSYADPGVLGRSREQARAWYKARLSETPGVLIVDEDSAGTIPLHVRWRFARPDPIMDRHYEEFLLNNRNPAGIDVTSGLERWRLDAQLGAGLFMRWKVPPPKEWSDARRGFASAVREAIENSTWSRRPLDTPAQVIRHCRDMPEVQAWVKIKPTFKPVTEVEWFSSSALEDARAWLNESRAPGVVWVGIPEFGHHLSRLTGLPYYGESGTDASGRFLNRADRSRSLIASWNANKEGFNLQDWKRALVCQHPQSALYAEQLYGRHHRRGQTDPVVYDVLISSGGAIDAFETMIREAETVKEREGLTQKILRATITRARPTITPGSEFRWSSRSKRA